MTDGPGHEASAQPVDSEAVLARLQTYRAHDAPTHGGSVLSYVYDSGLAALDDLAARAAALALPVNGLDPTTFPSVALMEADLVGFGRTILHGPAAVGSVTSGGTESCLLAVKAARDRWARARGGGAGGAGVTAATGPQIVLPSSAHAAFHKAAHYLGLEVEVVPVDPATGVPAATDLTGRFSDRTALVVVSAPSYPHGVLDPVSEVAAAAAAQGIPCHVDACIGGLVLPFWADAGGTELPPWDFRVPGVSIISADLHKFGYAPKGASLLLFADRELDLARYFALTDWPGYPVVNPTILGSRSATSLAAAWAVTTALGPEGYTSLTARVVAATGEVARCVGEIRGLRVLGEPAGPLLAVVSDETVTPGDRVHPHLWAAASARRGFVLQGQPSLRQSDGSLIPRSTHLTITPATHDVLGALTAVLHEAADEVRGATVELPADLPVPDPATLAAAARESGDLDLTQVLALIEQLPREATAGLLARFLQAFTAP
ncbi:aminotransferase class V-fold PLP-dependent enzyme [Ornithinimicrobium sp. F0845]|uniref:pyridoxal phosphate-dependent decarboxylase family protein n=1 Tax=Ornithinimicrobium sp. F0845 TaxID=2926412 RepID=UPI001FF36F70|nr:aminotransferase class V-fold PLP-dependent enzyme [Ornithinimicrobium sp. F0845]MCK0112889.1 aminotransferase class V-fold PLP-dependent enzyme [Ornithinimicrobium sp. F0845]